MSTQQLPTVPPIVRDRDALGPLDEDTLVVTSPSAYLAADKADVAFGSAEVVFAEDVQADSVGTITQVLALGSGATIDVAKMVAHQAELPLRVMPTVLSTDAPFSTVAAVRPHGIVDYVETGAPLAVILDFQVLEQAPWSAHLKGLGDVLAIESATRDWAARSPGQGAPERTAARALVDTALDSAGLWRAPSRQGMEMLSDLLRLKVHLGLHVEAPWLEEGTEHYLAYAIEPHLRNRAWHGDVLFACLRICAVLQRWEGERLASFRAFLRDLPSGSPSSPELTSDFEFAAVLRDLPRFCHTHELTNTVLANRHSVVHETDACAAWEAGW